jgi:hypothetical protein
VLAFTAYRSSGHARRQICQGGRVTGEGGHAIEKAAPAHVATVRQLVFDRLSKQQVAVLESTVNEAARTRGSPTAS